MEVINLGSLFFDGEPVELGAMYDKGIITIGNTVPGKTITFIKWNNLYVADRCVCTRVSWEDLDKHGFIFGQLVKIDGKVYLCRSLKVGAEKGAPSEWDAILDDLGDDDDLWHWKNRYFWGQEIPTGGPTGGALHRAVRGYHSARTWDYTVSLRYDGVGFRPVLEPLPSEAVISDVLVGRNIKIYGRGCSIAGNLIGYNDYDLELASAGSLPEVHPWIRQMKDTIFVDREAIVYLCEEG